MAEAIRRYLCDPESVVRQGHAARKRTESEFSIQSMVKGYMAVYDAVLKNRRRHGGKPSGYSSETSVTV